MALNGEGEPRATLMQRAEQAANVELYSQWQTYNNGVHMDWDTFRSINFRAIAVAVLTAAGFEVTALDAAVGLPHTSVKPITMTPAQRAAFENEIEQAQVRFMVAVANNVIANHPDLAQVERAAAVRRDLSDSVSHEQGD